MADRPDRACFNGKRTNDDLWVTPLALRYIGDAIVYLADVLKESKLHYQPMSEAEARLEAESRAIREARR